MRKLLLAAAALAVAAGTPALAQTRASAGFGPWQTTSGVASRGTPFCALYSAVQGRDAPGQNVFVKHFQGRRTLSVMLYRDSWLIPAGTDMEVAIDFADNEPLPFPARGTGHVVEILIETELVGDFLVRVAGRPAMQVHLR